VVVVPGSAIYAPCGAPLTVVLGFQLSQHPTRWFTVLNKEVRVWTIKAGSPALEAAGAMHSDMKKGFIRAEVLSFQHLREHGSMQEAKLKGLVHLKG
jgi:hypothetical protein